LPPAMPSKAEFTLSSNFSSMKAAEQPLVVLCGWINSKPKHVQKYADVFHGLGCATISSILPTAAGYSPFEYNARKYTERLLNFIEESMANDSEAQKIETTRKVVMVFFSNGGCWVLQYMEKIMNANATKYSRLRERIDGAIFDSSPCYMHVLVSV